MSTQELFEKIIQEPKWYAGIMSAQSAANIKKRHRQGTYQNYLWLFERLGYEASWTYTPRQQGTVIYKYELMNG